MKHLLNETEIDKSLLTDGIVTGGQCLSVRQIQKTVKVEFGTRVRVAVVFLMLEKMPISPGTGVFIFVEGGEYAIYAST